MPRRKALKVVVDVDFHAITCPGVFLPEREDIFINVEIMGQRKRTKCVPAVFPFLFHEKIRFEKVFGSATDPVQVATTLCTENAIIELVQLCYPNGNLLASYEDNARDFLFPTPRITPTYPGVDREVLMQRSSTFPGIAPKLEFSSRTIIKEVTSGGTSLSYGAKKHRPRPKSANVEYASVDYAHSSKKSTTKPRTVSPKKKQSNKRTAKITANNNTRGRERARSANNRATTMWGYEQPTIASRARSPSPYTRRRMAELSINDPFESATGTKPFKTEIDAKPEFVVRKVPEDALSHENTPRSPRSISSERKGRYSSPRATFSPSKRSNGSFKNSFNHDDITSEDYSDVVGTSLRSGRDSPAVATSTDVSPRNGGCYGNSFSRADLEPVSRYRSENRDRRMTPNSILLRTPLQERMSKRESPYEKIRDRVRTLLESPRARDIAEEAERRGRDSFRRHRSRSPSPRSPRVSVRMTDKGDLWDNNASSYAAKSHRQIFEGNLDKMYDDIYDNIKST